MGRLRITFIIDFLGGGGAERQLLHLINNLDRERFEPSLVLLVEEGSRVSQVRDDVAVSCLQTGRRSRYLTGIRRLRRHLARTAPDIVQCWSDLSVFTAACAILGGRRRPLLFASHRVSVEELYAGDVRFGRAKKAALLWAYRRALQITTNTRTLVDQLASYGLQRVTLIYNGVAIDCPSTRPELRARFRMGDDAYWIVYVGALVRRKGIFDLLQAFAAVADPAARLLVVGDGSERDAVARLAAADSRVTLTGYCENAVEYTKAADLLVLPSQYEGLPNAILEAMTVGTPVVATAIYGVLELIEHEVNGLLVEYGDVDGLRRALETAARNRDQMQAFATVSLSRAAAFTVDKMVHSYHDLYTSAATEAAR